MNKAKEELDLTVSLIVRSGLSWDDQDALVDTAMRIFDREFLNLA